MREYTVIEPWRSLSYSEGVYTGVRRSGLRGRVGLMRGVVRDDKSGAGVLVARSPEVAERLAQLLDGNVQPGETETRSPVSRYSAFVARPGSGVTVIAADGFSTGPRMFGDGLIAMTEDAELAGHLVGVLNRVDPALKARWWRGWF